MIRALMGLVLLSWLFLPVSLLIAVWTGEWRWLISGAVIALIGFAVGWLAIETGKRVKR